jgi:hypothetical protein
MGNFKKISSRFIYVLLAVIVLFGCRDANGNQPQKEIIVEYFGDGVSIRTIDSCEYVWVEVAYGGGLSHKGNCKFCSERKIKPCQ